MKVEAVFIALHNNNLQGDNKKFNCEKPKNFLQHSDKMYKMKQLFFFIGLLLPFFSFSQIGKANKLAVDTPVVLKNVSIVDGTGASIKHDQTLIIRNGKIAVIGVSSRVPFPAGDKVIDLSGHTIPEPCLSFELLA